MLAAALAVARAAATEASEHVLRYWPGPLNDRFDASLGLDELEKPIGVGNFATVADLESQRVIVAAIRAAPLLAGSAIASEEAEPIATDSDLRWVIDPIDGTIPFSHGQPEFGVSIGLLLRGAPELGVLAMPALGLLLVARRGHGVELRTLAGAFVRRLEPRVGPPIPGSRLLVAYDVGYEERGAQLRDTVAPIADHVGYCVSYCSAVTASFRMALGTVDAYLTRTPTIFDIAAAVVILGELGARTTDLAGRSLAWDANERGYLAARDAPSHELLLGLILQR